MGVRRRKYKFNCIALVAGLCIALSPIHAFADTQPTQSTDAQIDIGANGDLIDGNQLDQFVAAQESHAVKFVEIDEENNIVTSDKPIMHVYMASRLSDLGYAIQAEYAGTKEFVTKTSRFTLTDAHLAETPAIPEFVMSPNVEYQPAVTTYAEAAKAQTVAAKPAIKPTIKPQHRMSAQALALAIALAAAYVLLLLAMRPAKQARRIDYKGTLGAANDLVGHGAIFDFTGNNAHHVVFPSNLSYLHLMWNIKRVKDDRNEGVHTYFYMTFYIPPQQGFASSMQKRKVLSYHKSKIHF